MSALCWKTTSFPKKRRQNVRAQLESFTTEQLYARLEEVDPDSALRLHPNDRRRIERAVEVFLVTGKPISQQQAQMSRKKALPEPCILPDPGAV